MRLMKEMVWRPWVGVGWIGAHGRKWTAIHQCRDLDEHGHQHLVGHDKVLATCAGAFLFFFR